MSADVGIEKLWSTNIGGPDAGERRWSAIVAAPAVRAMEGSRL